MKFLFALSIASSLMPSVFAECCNRRDKEDCGDGTLGTPCCPYGSCNIFCCACAGGCRPGGLMGLAQSETLIAPFDTEVTAQAFEQADKGAKGAKGAKGYASLDDYLEHMQVKKEESQK
ncbi:hypothetical protein PG996_006740 [Apiospora saccharicola]|uniref:Uncharacterized protein n=1 Tax=Apiospora saccharicola TaxID=335842 RepID=A0ABR1V8X8_9PEZI